MFDIAVNDYPLQVQDFEFNDYNLQFTLRWNAVGLVWSFDLYDNTAGEYIVKNEGLSIGVPSLYYNTDVDFIFMLTDSTGLGYETIDISEMGDRIGIVIMTKDEYDAIW